MFFMTCTMAEAPIPREDKTDEQLLIRTAAGDRDAFRLLYENTYRSVYAYILSIVKNPADAEEIQQETYTRVWVSAPNYEAQGKPLAWIFTIARNQCNMLFRSRKHESGQDLEEISERELTDYCPELENSADRIALTGALSQLSEEERSIVLLHASTGLKHREIAENLALPLSTVLSKYNRAIKKLQKYLGEEG